MSSSGATTICSGLSAQGCGRIIRGAEKRCPEAVSTPGIMRGGPLGRTAPELAFRRRLYPETFHRAISALLWAGAERTLPASASATSCNASPKFDPASHAAEVARRHGGIRSADLDRVTGLRVAGAPRYGTHRYLDLRGTALDAPLASPCYAERGNDEGARSRDGEGGTCVRWGSRGDNGGGVWG